MTIPCSKHGWLFATLILLFIGSSAFARRKEKILYSFQGIPDGETPASGVVFDKTGNLYGTTTNGGSDNCPGIAECGTVFQLQPPIKKDESWTEKVLYIFKGVAYQDGETPAGGVIFDKAGNLYGTTAYGGAGNCELLGTLVGCGVVFEMTPPKTKGEAWMETVLYSFQGGKDGDVPQGDLVFDSAGNLYGATLYGGGYGRCNAPYFQYCGVIFQLSPPKAKGGKWKEKVLYSFKSGADGTNPNGGLVFDRNGLIYGTTYAGGTNECRYDASIGCGTAFELAPPTNKAVNWKETIIHRFDPNDLDGGNPAAGVVFDGGGNLIGTTTGGGPKVGGTVFSLGPPTSHSGKWHESFLYEFAENQNGFSPEAGLALDDSGNLYGVALGGYANSGVVFRLKKVLKPGKLWPITILHTFTGSPDARFPTAKLILDHAGALYSTTQAGGTGQACRGGCGTVFEVSP